MTGNSPRPKERGAEELETRMRKASRAVSLGGMGLMFAGFVMMASNAVDASLALPGAAVLPIGRLIHLQAAPLGLLLTSAGIILFCLLPAVRVLLAFWLYLRSRDFSATLVAVIVFLELLISIRIAT